MVFNRVLIVLMMLSGSGLIFGVVRCSRLMKERLTETHQKMVDERKEFMKQCSLDGYNKTTCTSLYNDKGPSLEGLLERIK